MEELRWPPNKENLQWLYCEQKLSAAKIAHAYGLKYPNPKSGETLVLYHLKKFGIARRGKADHVKKVTEEMVEDWIKRYNAGESLKQIAGDVSSPVTVWNHLRRHGIILRDKVEAQISAVSKYERKPFAGDRLTRAYLIGLRYGDLNAVRHGRAVRIRVSTTRPAMAELFESLFCSYGFVHWYPREAQLSGYEWSLECDLDSSFEFLLTKPRIPELEALTMDEFVAFVSGFFDAEGTIYLHKKQYVFAPEVYVTNTDCEVLALIARRLRSIGVVSKIEFRQQAAQRLGYSSDGVIWRLVMWQIESVHLLLRSMTLRHKERVWKAQLALAFRSPLSNKTNLGLPRMWVEFADVAEKNRIEFIEKARAALLNRTVQRNANQRIRIHRACCFLG